MGGFSLCLPISHFTPGGILCSETLSAFTMDFSFLALKECMNHRELLPIVGLPSVPRGRQSRREEWVSGRGLSIPFLGPRSHLSSSITGDAVCSLPEPLPPTPPPLPFLGPSPEMPCSVWYASLSLWGTSANQHSGDDSFQMIFQEQRNLLREERVALAKR